MHTEGLSQGHMPGWKRRHLRTKKCAASAPAAPAAAAPRILEAIKTSSTLS